MLPLGRCPAVPSRRTCPAKQPLSKDEHKEKPSLIDFLMLLPQIEFLKLTFGTTGMLKKINENFLMHIWHLELMQWSVQNIGRQEVG